MDDDRADKNNDGDDNDNESLPTNEEDMSLMSEEDWSDHSSVTTDEEPTDPPTKKNIHSRRWTLVPKDDGSFIIEGGRKPKTIDKSTRSWSIELNKHLADADIIIPHGRNGHVSPGLSFDGYISRTISTMTADFRHYQNLWLESKACTSLRGTIQSLKGTKDRYVPVDNIVCLALGSPQHTKEICRAASLTQLAVLLTIMEELDLNPQTMSQKPVAQDPSFTPLDAEFLSSLGFAVVDDPEGFLAITENTLVYSIGGYLDMEWVISQGPWPGALICADTEAFIKRLLEDKKGG
ncbi:hypothetical protein V491_02992, partial [Pseudogymnoascus sp. VKM F-3775]